MFDVGNIPPNTPPANRRIPRCNGIAPKGNGSARGCAATLNVALARAPSYDTATRLSGLYSRHEPPSVPTPGGFALAFQLALHRTMFDVGYFPPNTPPDE